MNTIELGRAHTFDNEPSTYLHQQPQRQQK